MADVKLDECLVRLAFQTDILQHLEAKLGAEVEIISNMGWFELGMLYSEMNLSKENDEVAAAKLVEAAVKMLL